ncbi:MAG: MerR family transcriptional regulator [Acidobacteriota bacterium]
MAQAELRIGELAARTGVSIDTVRYYERRRLLPRATRTGGGFRLFTPETVKRILFIKQAQHIGLSLDTIMELLATRGGAGQCLRVSELLRVKLAEMDERIKAMRDFRRTLSGHLAACERELMARGAAAACPVLEGITHTATSPKAGPPKEKR